MNATQTQAQNCCFAQSDVAGEFSQDEQSRFDELVQTLTPGQILHEASRKKTGGGFPPVRDRSMNSVS
jgi:hypothetical protein